MSNEEMNKKMEVIVEQQTKLADAVITVVGLVGTLTRTQLAADDRISELTQIQAHTDDRINALVQAQTRTGETIQLLIESQARTDERLNIFINVVERHISGNGGAENRA
jgi:phosphoribosyl-dephospho-CoA transferase